MNATQSRPLVPAPEPGWNPWGLALLIALPLAAAAARLPEASLNLKLAVEFS